jgi:hypothetical protein
MGAALPQLSTAIVFSFGHRLIDANVAPRAVRRTGQSSISQPYSKHAKALSTNRASNAADVRSEHQRQQPKYGQQHLIEEKRKGQEYGKYADRKHDRREPPRTLRISGVEVIANRHDISWPR